jgi:hypothetical protein
MTLRPICKQTIKTNASITKKKVRRWTCPLEKKHHYDDDYLSHRRFTLLVTPLNIKISWRGGRSWQWRPKHTQPTDNNASTTKRRQWRWACSP